MERAGKGNSQFVIPGPVRTEMRDSDEPSRVLHDYITGPLVATVLQQAQGQLDTLIGPALAVSWESSSLRVDPLNQGRA